MTMCTCIIPIINLPAKQQGIHQFMWEKKIKTSETTLCNLITKNYTDEGLQHDNIRQRMLCKIELRKYQPTWMACDRVSY